MSMFRSSISEAIVLRKARVGEIHKSLTLMTPDKGLIQALAHGACKIKSRLRAPSEPFGYIRVYLYHDPVRNQYKITDIEVLDLFETIRHSLNKFYTASLWAEVTLKSFGGGESHAVLFQLLIDAFQNLSRVAEERVLLLSLQFLYRFLDLSGYMLNAESCDHCSALLAAEAPRFFSLTHLSWLCARCAGGEALELSAGACRYLQNTVALPLSRAVSIGLEQRSVTGLKRFLYELVQSVLETRLNTLLCGVGAL